MTKRYSDLSPEELREYHRAAWRRYYQRNSDKINEHTIEWRKANKEKNRIAGNIRARRYKEKIRLNNLRSDILSRDNHSCTSCGGKNKLIIHHIDQISWHNSNIPNNSPSNLLTMCRSCHSSLHNNIKKEVK